MRVTQLVRDGLLLLLGLAPAGLAPARAHAVGRVAQYAVEELHQPGTERRPVRVVPCDRHGRCEAVLRECES